MKEHCSHPLLQYLHPDLHISFLPFLLRCLFSLMAICEFTAWNTFHTQPDRREAMRATDAAFGRETMFLTVLGFTLSSHIVQSQQSPHTQVLRSVSPNSPPWGYFQMANETAAWSENNNNLIHNYFMLLMSSSLNTMHFSSLFLCQYTFRFELDSLLSGSSSSPTFPTLNDKSMIKVDENKA